MGWALTHGVWVASNAEESYFTLRHTSDMIRDTYRDVDMFFFFLSKIIIGAQQYAAEVHDSSGIFNDI